MKKLNKKTTATVICGLTAASIVYATSSKVINANQYVTTTDDAILLNVDKQDKDTVKIGLSNFGDLAKSLQLSFKIEGNAKFEENSIKWLVDSEETKAHVKMGQDNKSLDIFIVSSDAIKADGGIIEICEIDVAKDNELSSDVTYSIVPNVNDQGIAYNYVLHTTNKKIEGSNIANYSNEKLSINNAPNVTLKNLPTIVEGKIVVQKGSQFNALDYIDVIDDEDGTLQDNKVKVDVKGRVNTSKVGSYSITYTATDTVGDKTELKATVIVEETAVNKEAPVINMASDIIEIKVGQELNLKDGITATDYLGRELEVEVNGAPTDLTVVGEYEITYTATDSLGKTTTATRTLKINKPDAPVIEGVRNEVTITVGEAFNPADGVKAVDYSGKEIEVKIAGDYDINTPGEYTIKYSATDSYGTAAELTTKLIVKEKSEQLPNEPGNGGVEDNNTSNPDKPGDDNTGDNNTSQDKPGNDNVGNNNTTSQNKPNNSNTTNNAQQNNTSNSAEKDKNNNKLPATGQVVGGSLIATIGALMAALGIKLSKKK